MPNKYDLLDLVNHETLAIIWPCKNRDPKSYRFFDQLDYLFDGLLHHTGLERNFSTFITTHFNQSFFLFYFKDDEKIHAIELKNQIKRAYELAPAKKNIIIISQDSSAHKVCTQLAEELNLQTVAVI